MNEIKEARLKANLTQSAMAKLLNIPQRNIERWETDNVKPPDWTKALILEKLERIGEEVKERFITGTYYLGTLFGYLDNQFLTQKGRSVVNPALLDKAYREPLTYTMQLLKQAHQQNLKLDEDLISMIINKLEVSQDKDNYGNNPWFNKKLLVEEQGNFAIGHIKGRALIYSPIYKVFNDTHKNLYDIANEFDINQNDLLNIITGFKQLEDCPLELISKCAKATNKTISDFANLKFI